MLQITYLTDEETLQLDPHQFVRQWYGSCFGADAHEKPSALFGKDPKQIMDDYISRFCSDEQLRGKHSPIVSYDREMALHKTGPQGGVFPLSKGKEIAKEFYDHAEDPHEFEIAKIGRELFIKLIMEAIKKNGLPVIIPYLVRSNKAAGLPFGGHKNDWSIHLSGHQFWAHAVAALLSARRMRNKDRDTFCESVLNLDQYQYDLSAVRNWLKSQFPHLFGAWLNPTLTLYPDLTNSILSKKLVLETDFKAMDQHFSWDVVRNIILPIYEVLLPEGEYLHFAQLIEEAFQVPLYFGNEVWTGLHNLFSGQGFTNDFETIYDVCVYLGAWVVAGGSTTEFQYSFKALGDDVVLTGKDDMIYRVYDLVRKEFKRNGVVISEEKTRIQKGEARFCRMVYYDRLPTFYNERGELMMQPSYPPSLALNNTIQPEFPNPSWKKELLSDFTRMDNCVGYYQFNNFCSFVFNNMKPIVVDVSSNESNSEFETMQMKDWWYTVYGTTYTLGESPAAKIYKDQYYQKFVKTSA